MKFHTKVFACIGAGALLASGAAMAAVDVDNVHVALSSLRLAMVKTSVANAMLTESTPPSSNAEAHIAAPNKLSGDEIQAILVSEGGVINVYLTPRVGITGAVVQLVPAIVTDKDGQKGVQYNCYSPNIPDIAKAVPGCTYHPSGE